MKRCPLAEPRACALTHRTPDRPSRHAMNPDSLSASPLGHSTPGSTHYDPTLLFPLTRAETRAGLTPYIKSKTIAEKAAWQFVKETASAPELAVINPAFVQGPALDDDLSTSHELFRLMARGLYPAAPRIRFPVTDVRDVAAAHAEAALRPEAAGKRYLIGEGQFRLYELGRVLARELPDLRGKVPKFELPDAAVRALAVFDKRLRTILPELGAEKDYTNARVRMDLGLNLRSADDAVTAAVRSLRDLRLI